MRGCTVMCERRLGRNLPGVTTRTSTSRARLPRISVQLLRIVYMHVSVHMLQIQSYAIMDFWPSFRLGTLESSQ